MPRGTQSIELITPMAGFRGDLPPHKLQPDMLTTGSFNVVCSPTAQLRARNGFARVTPPNVGPQKALTGGVTWEGFNGIIYTIVADTGNWWRYIANTGSITNWAASTVYNLGALVIDSNGNTQQCTTAGTSGTTSPVWANSVGTTTADGSGSLTWTMLTQLRAQAWTSLNNPAAVPTGDFTVFSAFAISGVDNLWGVNNGGNGLLRWQAGNGHITTVSGTPFSAALGCFVLANRLVVFGTTESGVYYANRIRWSENNDPTTWHAAAVADLTDPGGGITAGMRMGNLQAFIYLGGTEGQGAIWTMIAQAGDDANAFSFQEFALGEGAPPPASVASIIAVQGTHYYLGLDLHIWSFNGVAPQNFGIAVQSDIMANANAAEITNSFAVYVPSDRHGRFYFPSGTSTMANRCVYYSFDFSRWEAPALYSQGFTCGFSGPLSSQALEAALVGGADGGMYQLDVSLTDNGAPIQFNATWGVINVDALSKMAVQFVEGFIQQANANDYVALVINGLRTPLDTPASGAVFLMELSQANQFQQMAAPGIGSTAATYYNWLQASLQGNTAGNFVCVGGYIQVNTVLKGVSNVHGNGPE